VQALLERVARSPLPPYHTVSPFVARRIYRDTRAVLAPQAPEVAEVRLLAFENYAMRVYRPAFEHSAGETLPALMYFHGGGWTIGDLDTHDVLCRSLAVGARCVVFSVDYRLAPEYPFPAAVDDCFAATRYVAENAAKLKIHGIAVGGDSAGGNLAATIALLAREQQGPAIAFQLLIYPATDQRLASASTRSMPRPDSAYGSGGLTLPGSGGRRSARVSETSIRSVAAEKTSRSSKSRPVTRPWVAALAASSAMIAAAVFDAVDPCGTPHSSSWFTAR